MEARFADRDAGSSYRKEQHGNWEGRLTFPAAFREPGLGTEHLDHHPTGLIECQPDGDRERSLAMGCFDVTEAAGERFDLGSAEALGRDATAALGERELHALLGRVVTSSSPRDHA